MTDFVDVSTIRRTGPTVQFRAERRLDAPFNVGGRIDVDLVSELYEADCEALTYQPLQRAAYLSRRLVIPTYSPDEAVRTARPGTVIASLIAFACANRPAIDREAAASATGRPRTFADQRVTTSR